MVTLSPRTPRCGNCGAAVSESRDRAEVLCGRALQRIKLLGDNRGEWMGANSWCPLWPLASVKAPPAGQPGSKRRDGA